MANRRTNTQPQITSNTAQNEAIQSGGGFKQSVKLEGFGAWGCKGVRVDVGLKGFEGLCARRFGSCLPRFLSGPSRATDSVGERLET